jgi:hypothetical protein
MPATADVPAPNPNRIAAFLGFASRTFPGSKRSDGRDR